NVMGADQERRGVVIGDAVEIGTTIQFHVRDAASADEDLRDLLAGHEAAGALVFTCNGRGIRLFGEPDHDATLIDRIVEGGATAPDWPNRGRFVLSAGDASIVLYSMLHLTGYGLTREDLESFRQWGSLTPGHPEAGHTVGVEVTTGPLGQGVSNGVGMAIAE